MPVVYRVLGFSRLLPFGNETMFRIKIVCILFLQTGRHVGLFTEPIVTVESTPSIQSHLDSESSIISNVDFLRLTCYVYNIIFCCYCSLNAIFLYSSSSVSLYLHFHYKYCDHNRPK